MALFVGAISGTSIDGLDLSIVDVTATDLTVPAATTIPIPTELQDKLRKLALGHEDSINNYGLLHSEFGTFCGTAIVDFIKQAGLTNTEITAIGSHGQTVLHQPSLGFSLQLGDASRIAYLTQIDTVSDFRAADLATGGEGAPLVPIFHDRIFRSTTIDRIVLNIGGIANLTVLPADPSATVTGFDTGPGNALLDTWTQTHFDEPYDVDGWRAANADVNEQLLMALLDEPWLDQPPPKSTGKERFNDVYVQQASSQLDYPLNSDDVLATLTEFTVTSIRDAILKWGSSEGEVIVCGGGRLNKHLIKRLSLALPSHGVSICDQYGIDGDAVEAAAFGYLAYLYMNRLPGNLGSVTGASDSQVLGCLYPAAAR